ncbi:MAG: hypothetical protein J1F23_06945 [Oscillospiraceae bacterium]|nr:hypothetical protein [Oscillospiraceae bacterium]
MKYIHIVVTDTENGKHRAHAEKIPTGTNLKNCNDMFPNAKVIHLCESSSHSKTVADYWNESYKKNGTYLYN